MEQHEYNKEKIIWKNIAFIDNQSVLDMIGLKPCNVMSLIDEESKFPKGNRTPDMFYLFIFNRKNKTKIKNILFRSLQNQTHSILTDTHFFRFFAILYLCICCLFVGTDTTLLMKLNANHGSKTIFVKPFSDHAVSFGIRHFAGVVMYYSKGMNRIT